jgi:hypothetical protein
MEVIERIRQNSSGLLHWRCSCEQYYLQKYSVSIDPTNNFSTWGCDGDPNVIYREKCSSQSTVNVTNIKPRLCKINYSEPGNIPEYVESNSCNSEVDIVSFYIQISNIFFFN